MIFGSRKIPISTFISLVCIYPISAGAVTFFSDFTNWANATDGTIKAINLFDANDVALADEVASAPIDGQTLPTSVLTFDSANTGFNQTITVQLLESPEFVFQTIGARTGLEPSLSTQEDFRQLFEVGTRSLAMEITEQQKSATWNLYDSSAQLIGSVTSSGSGNVFYGAVSTTTIAYAEWIHDSSGLTDNVGIGTQYFNLSTIPEPNTTALFLGASALALLIFRRRLCKKPGIF